MNTNIFNQKNMSVYPTATVRTSDFISSEYPTTTIIRHKPYLHKLTKPDRPP